MLTLNQIHHGCCLDLMQHIPDGSIDMVLCDLPYGTTQNKWDTVIPFDKLWAAYERVIKPNGAIILTAAQPFTSALVMSNIKIFKWADCWDKKMPVGFLNAKRRPLRRHEDILMFSNGQPTYNPLMRTGILRRKGTGGATESYGAFTPSNTFNDQYYPTSIIEVSNAAQAGKEHPTQKPVALFEYLIRTYTNPGEVVLDNCAGSFTTAVAAENTGRRWICIEQEAKYCEIGRARLAALQPQLALC